MNIKTEFCLQAIFIASVISIYWCLCCWKGLSFKLSLGFIIELSNNIFFNCSCWGLPSSWKENCTKCKQFIYFDDTLKLHVWVHCEVFWFFLITTSTTFSASLRFVLCFQCYHFINVNYSHLCIDWCIYWVAKVSIWGALHLFQGHLQLIRFCQEICWWYR